MLKKIIVFQILLLIAFQGLNAQAHNSKHIYNHINEIQEEFSEISESLFSINRNLSTPSDANKYVQNADYLVLDESFAQNIKAKRPNTLYVDLPFQGSTYKIQLYKKDVTTPSYMVKTASGSSTSKTKSVFYRGVVKNDENSIVSLSILTNGIRMTIANEQGNFEINKVSESLYAAYKVADSKHSQDTGCATDNLSLPDNVVISEESAQRSTGDCIEVYIECDFDSYIKNGSSVSNTEDWALSIMNEVEILYENEGVPMAVSEILVYDSSDPYSNFNGTGDMLDQMGFTIGNNYNGRLAHLFSTRSVGGGIAWLNVLCATNNGGAFGPYAVSGSMSSNVVPFPIFSWNVMVVAHELGHNIGSSHTHSCVWNGNGTQIDDCGPVAGYDTSCYDENNPILPSGGTIMSYCHLVGGVGINFNNGFGSLPGALLFNKYVGANCVTGDECAFGGGNGGPPPVADFSHTQFDACAPSTVQFTNQSFNDPVSYEWFLPGATPDYSTDEDPLVVYYEPGFYDVTLIATNANGSDEWTVNELIEIQEPPIPDFDFEFVGFFIDFTNQTNQSVNSFFWDFGDGNFSNAENPFHEYLDDGTYTVTLTVESDCGIFEVQKIVEYYIPPTAGFDLDNSSGCSPLTVTYTNSSSNNAVDFLWSFEGGMPASSTEENPVVSYLTPGVYDVSLVVSNANGEDALVESDLITIEASPIADFTFSVNALDVEFSNISSGYQILEWNFGDGNTSDLVDPSHSYSTGGIYAVSLIVESDNCGTAEIVKEIDVTGAPMAVIEYNINEGCTGQLVNFSASNSSSAESYLWVFEGGNPASSTEQSITVEYPNAGVFDVSLTVSNTVGDDVESISDAIVIYDSPLADFVYELNDLTIDLEAIEQINLGTTYTWDLGDGNMATGLTATHSYSEEGIYDITLFTSSLCGEEEITQTINNFSSPSASFTLDQDEGCADFTVQMSNTSSANVTEWLWTFSGGSPATSTEENPTVIYSEAGSYSVQLIVSNPNGSDEITQEDIIVVHDVPVAEFSMVSNMNTVSFTNSSMNGDSFNWNFGDGNSSVLENPSHTYDQEGNYEVTLRVTNACGTTETTKTLILSSIPVAGYSANVSSGCIPLTVDFSNNSSANVTEWNWSFPGGNPASSSEESPSVVYEMSGLFDVTLIVSSNGGNDTLEMQEFISASDLPTASFQYVSTTVLDYSFTNTSFDASSYKWDFGDGNISDLENPTHSYAGPGTYLITLEATNGCGTEIWTEEITIEESTSVLGIDFLSSIHIYPNPNSGNFILNLESKKTNLASISIFNVLGQKIQEDKIQLNAGTNTRALSIENATSGAYFMIIRSGEQSQVMRVVVH